MPFLETPSKQEPYVELCFKNPGYQLKENRPQENRYPVGAAGEFPWSESIPLSGKGNNPDSCNREDERKLKGWQLTIGQFELFPQPGNGPSCGRSQ